MNFTPCSAKHKSCSPAHAAMVRSYREERQRQEQELENMTGNGRGEREHWKHHGGKLIDFKSWLIGNKRSNDELKEIEEYESLHGKPRRNHHVALHSAAEAIHQDFAMPISVRGGDWCHAASIAGCTG